MIKETFHVAVPTAFLNDESINIKGTMAHILDLYRQGVKSVFISGTTGEQHSMTLNEKFELINRLVKEEELLNNMEIIFGVSSIRQKDAEELAKKLRHTKIAGVMIGYPPYIIPTQEEALEYTKRLIHYSNKPTILYNNPRRTGFDLSVESIVHLSKIDLVIGIKEAGSPEKVSKIKEVIQRKDFHYYAGGEVGLEEKVIQGYDRLSSIAGNVYPLEVHQWFQKLLNNEVIFEQEKIKIQKMMEQVYQGNAIVNVKKMLNQRGIPMGICRSPIGSKVNE